MKMADTSLRALAVGSVLALASVITQANTVEANSANASATLAVTSQWGGGYCASVTVTNAGNAAISGWQVELVTDNADISNLWSGDLSGNVVSGAAYNNQIAAGKGASFGFCGVGSGLPSVLSLVVDGGSTGTASSAVTSSSVVTIPSSSSSEVVISSSSVVSIPSSAAASSTANCDAACNWYGEIRPLCQQQDSGWGWENQQSCIGADTCNAQWGGGGVEQGNCNTSESSAESSLVASSSSSLEPSSSSEVSSSSSHSSIVQSSSSSLVSSSSSVSSEQPGDVIPNAASNGWPYCRSADSDPDGDGWGWENSYSCIVFASSADPGVGDFSNCLIGGEELTLCGTETGSWGAEGGEICLSRSMCPGMGSPTQGPMRNSPVNSDANAITQSVYTYLQSVWGHYMLSGQQDQTWKDSIDQYQRCIDDTGRAPAMMGYDFMNYGLYWNGISGLTQTEEAIEHWQRGGLVSFAWHWRDPNADEGTVGEFYSEDTAFEIPIVNGELDTASASYANMEADIEMIAAELQTLEDAGVPVLWRPLHEASGGWFWWGRSDRADGVPAAFAQVVLWRHLYERLTNDFGLDNLIWIWNGQSGAWYPGDNYVDIVSHDIYDGENNYESQIGVYDLAAGYSQEVKMVALSENSNIPDPDLMAVDGAWWLYFMVWNDGDTEAGVTSNNNFWTGEYFNSNAHKVHVYNHDLVITLDELPAF